MRVILFGASGMVGQGVLRECLIDRCVDEVLSFVRKPTGVRHPKLEEIAHRDLFDYSGIEGKVAGLDACFFCLGVSAAGMREEEYRRWRFDLTLAAARTLAARNPRVTFVYVSGAGTDGSEAGRTMWARVKGKTEHALLRLPFRSAYMFRPTLIAPIHANDRRRGSIASSTGSPHLPLLRRLFPRSVTTTEQMGRAMIAVARRGAPKPILENGDINRM